MSKAVPLPCILRFCLQRDVQGFPRIRVSFFSLILLILFGAQTPIFAAAPEILWTRGGHGDEVDALAISPNGTLLASGSRDETLKLWRISDGTLLRTLRFVRPFSVRFSPDGALMAAGGAESNVKVWRVDDGSLAYSFLQPNDVHSIDFSPDGGLIAAAGKDTFIRVWNLEDESLKHSLRGLSDRSIHHVQFSPDGQIIARDNPYQVDFWRVSDATPVGGFTNSTPSISELAFSPDSQQFALAHNQNGPQLSWISLHSMVTGASNNTISIAAENLIDDISFSPDGQSIAGHEYNPFSATNRFLRRWSLPDQIMREQIPTGPFTDTIQFNPNWSRIVLNGFGNSAQITMLDRPGGEVLRHFCFHLTAVSKLAFTWDGRVISSSQNAIHSWRATDGTLLWSATSNVDRYSQVALSPDGAEIAVAARSPPSQLSTIQFLNGETGLFSSRSIEAGELINTLDISPDGLLFAAAGSATNVRIWNRADLSLNRTLRGHTRSINRIAFSSGSRQLLSSAGDRTIRLWDVITGSELWAVTNTGLSTLDFAFSPDGNLIATAELDSMIRLRRVADGTVAQILTNSATVRVLAFSPDNRTLLSANDNDTVRVWNFVTGELLHTYDNAVWNCREIAVGSDGAFAFGRADGTFAVARNFGSDLLRLQAMNSATGGFQLHAQGPVGRSLLVEISADLRSWSIFTNVTLSTTEMEIVDVDLPPDSHRFYRGSIQN